MPHRLKSPAFERNRDPILSELKPRMTDLDPNRVLEVACGPGQHAHAFAAAMPHLHWFPTDKDPQALASTNAWQEHSRLPNMAQAQAFDVGDPASLSATDSGLIGAPFGAAVAINLLHMVPLDVALRAVRSVSALLAPGARFFVYDCFTFEGRHTAPSNVNFDAHLRTIGGAVHPIEDVDAVVEEVGLTIETRVALPANNFMMIWRKAQI